MEFRAWLRSYYASLRRLNAAWGTRYREWGQVDPPTLWRGQGRSSISYQSIKGGQAFRDFIAFRTLSLKRMYDTLRDAVNSADSMAAYGVQWGASAIGADAPLRGTLPMGFLTKNVDWVFSGAQGNAPQALFDDVTKCSVSSGVMVSREIDSPSSTNGSAESYRAEAAAALKRGFSVDLANWDSKSGYDALSDPRWNSLFAVVGEPGGDTRADTTVVIHMDAFDVNSQWINYNRFLSGLKLRYDKATHRDANACVKIDAPLLARYPALPGSER